MPYPPPLALKLDENKLKAQTLFLKQKTKKNYKGSHQTEPYKTTIREGAGVAIRKVIRLVLVM
jgi:hypothetical protein